jgi:hypothetical protein
MLRELAEALKSLKSWKLARYAVMTSVKFVYVQMKIWNTTIPMKRKNRRRRCNRSSHPPSSACTTDSATAENRTAISLANAKESTAKHPHSDSEEQQHSA